MKNNLNNKESLEIINAMIGEAKIKVQENGKWYIFWGAFCTIIPLAVYVLKYIYLWKMWYFPFWGFALASLIQFFVIALEKSNTQKVRPSLLEHILGLMWAIIGVNALLIGFLLWKTLGLNTIPLIVLMFGVGTSISGFSIRDANVWLGGLLMNASALLVIYLQVPYGGQLIYMSLMSFFGIFCTGLGLLLQHRKRNA